MHADPLLDDGCRTLWEPSSKSTSLFSTDRQPARPPYFFLHAQNVGSMDAGPDANGMDVDGAPAAKRKLYVGQQAVNFRRDNMEVRMWRRR